MIAGQLDHLGPWNRSRELALLSGPNEAVAGGDDHGGGHVDRPRERAGVVGTQRPAGVGDGTRVAPTQLGSHPISIVRDLRRIVDGGAERPVEQSAAADRGGGSTPPAP